MKDSIVIGHMLRILGGSEDIDPAALLAARTRRGSALDKLYAYLNAHGQAGAFKASWQAISSAVRWCIWGGALLALTLGALAATSAFSEASSPALGVRQVNVFWLLSSLLGVHVLTFLMWAIAMVRARASRVSLLQFVHATLAFVMRKSPSKRIAAQCFADTHLSRPIGPWLMSVLSHGLWALYLAAGWVAAILLLSIQSYSFIWETTLLNAPLANQIVSWLAAPLAGLGVSVPDAQMVAAAQNTALQPAAVGDAGIWAQFCLAAILVYGVAPRALLWAVCYARFKALTARYSLDPAEPFFARLLARIYQPGVQRAIVDADDEGRPAQTQSAPTAIDKPAKHALSNAKIIGWEVDSLEGKDLQGDLLGLFDQTQDLKEVMAAIPQAPVLLVVSALNTPDRGVEHALSPFKSVAQGQRAVLIGDVDMLRARATEEDVTRRIGDWWSLLTRLGFEPSSIQIEGSNR